MTPTEFEATIVRLETRIAALERALRTRGPAQQYVEGWSRAAQILGISVPTLKARSEEMPKPVRQRVHVRSGEPYVRPVWLRSDLVAYTEGTYRAK
jgi:hypothetical protein